jgi:hypothetical protein
MDYIIMDPVTYKNGKFRFFKGDIGGPQDVVDPPEDTTGLNFIQSTDEDPVVFSFMNEAVTPAQPLALVCVIATDFGTGKSTGRYYVCKPTIVNNNISWTLLAGPITLKFGPGTAAVEVAGNPHGVAQVGTSLHIQDYDNLNNVPYIYTVSIAALVGAGTAASNVTVTRTAVTMTDPPFDGSAIPHGNGLIALTDPSNTSKTYLYAVYNGAIENASHMPTDYVNGVVVRLDSSDMATDQISVEVGENAMGLVPLPIPAPLPGPSGTTSGLAIAVPCLGGTYKTNATNGADSKLFSITNIFASTMTATAAIVGDSTTTLTEEGTRDFKSVTFSEDGLFGYVLTVTYDSNGFAWWKIYQTTAANILGANGVVFQDAIKNNLLVFLEGSLTGNGSDWEVVYENEATPVDGRLWFVQGSIFRVSQGSLYSVSHDFVQLYDNTTKKGYINSADLIREMIYQYGKGHSINTRLIKGKTAAAKVSRVAAVRAVAAPEEEEEEEK